MSHSIESLGPEMNAHLIALERTIEEGLHAFQRVGNALIEIRDQGLYLAKYESFEEYCRARWKFSRTRAYQLIDASELTASVSTMVDTPPIANERQARALLPLKNEPLEIQRTLKALHDEHGDSLTAEKVKQAVDAKVKRDAKAKSKVENKHDKQLRKTALRLGDWQVDQGDITEPWAGEPVDCIITDPPYNRDAVELYGDLATLAGDALKPGGDLVVMTGQSYLPDVLTLLQTDELIYRWTLAYLTPGGQASQIWQRNVNSFWKPVIWLTKGHRTSTDWIGDTPTSPPNDNDKRFHKWGQSVAGMDKLVDCFTDAGQSILDPFCGGGGIGVAAVMAGRHYLAFDLDANAVSTTRGRLEAL